MTIRVSTVQTDVAIIENTDTVQVSTVQADVAIVENTDTVQLSTLQADVAIVEDTNTVQLSTFLVDVMYVPHLRLGSKMGTYVKVKSELTGLWTDVVTCSKQKVA